MPVGFTLDEQSYVDGLASDLLQRQENDPLLYQYPEDDQSWIARAFVVTQEQLSPDDTKNRSFSVAALKYTDTSIGGHHAINPHPAPTRYADLRVPGFRANAVPTQVSYTGGSLGMPRYYAEAMDENAQIVHFRFGVTTFSSLTQFFTGFYNSSMAGVARSARADDNFINAALQGIGAVGGKVAALAAITIAPILIIPIVFSLVGTAARYLAKMPSTKYAYLKPAMPLYWNAVNSMVNQISVNLGLVAYVSPDQQEMVMGKEQKFSSSELSIFSALMPEFSKKGLIDVYALATKAKRLQIRHELTMAKRFEEGGADDWYGIVRKVVETDRGGVDQPHRSEPREISVEALWQRWLDNPLGRKRGENDNVENALRKAQKSENLSKEQQIAAQYEPNSSVENSAGYYVAEVADGSQFVSFRVDHTGASSESFQNGSEPSALQQKANSISASARSMSFNLAGGDVDPLGVTQGIKDAVTSFTTNMLDTLHLSGLAAFAGAAFVDIPENWNSATAKLPQASYSFTLISPYGNVVSQMFNIYIPLACILAGALPLSTGPQSYTAPFMCEFYDRGRQVTRYGMIDSLSITRGTSNLAFTREGRALAVEVSFTVKDLSSILHMPIQPGFNPFKPLEGMFDGDNAFEDYLAVITGMTATTLTQRWPMLKNRINKKIASVDSFFSPAHFAQWQADLPAGQVLSMFMRGTDRK